MMPELSALAERVSLAEAAGGAVPKRRRFRARLIAGDIQGSSGYYPAQMLRESASAFGSGLPMFIDHPSISEAHDRPERSVRDLAGRLASDARYEADGLYADVEVYPHWAPIIEAMADDIGLSIRAAGTVEASTDDRIRGPIVTRISEAQSVDFVTAAGAGGKLVQLLESARARALEERGTWREGDHPRGYHGRFGHGGGSPSNHTSGGGGGRAGDSPAGGGPSRPDSGASGEKGMPKVLASAEVPLKSGGTLKLDREHDGDRITLTHGDHSTSLSRDGAHKLARELTLADDWGTGEEDTFDGAGHIRKTGPGAYDVTLPDGTKLTMSRRDAVKFEQTLEGLDASSRVDTGNGDLDVFSPGRGKIGYRHLGDDGSPVEVVFDRKSYRKISDTIDRIIDDVDAPDVTKPVTRREISTNAGKVSVELFGKWGGRNPGDRLEIMPVDGDPGWGMVIDGPQQRDWADANDRIMQEAAGAKPGPGVRLVEAKVSDTPWSNFGQGDYDIGQWRRACLIGPTEQSDSKADYALPVREPDGTLNRNAVHTAASRIKQVKTDPAAKRAAARKLVRLYGQLGEDPPAALLDLAGMRRKTTTKESAMPQRDLLEARTIGAWVESRLHLALTTLGDDMYGDGRLTREERKILSSAVGAALDAFSAAIEDAAPQLYERGPYDDPDNADQADAEMSESARRLAEAAGITANDLRDALCAAVRDVYGGEGIWVWVRDHTDEWVVFSMEDNAPGDADLFQQTYTLDAGRVTLTGDPVEVRAVTTYEPQPEQEPETGSEPAKTGPPVSEATAKTAPGTAPEPAPHERRARCPN
ncbi:hypothetical protein [Microbispora sp. GKU 823]|uniref:hypothetical protein n=1 Tax=Microbispora sp. GKU 823 TaxID=1652100 RepID=UPI0009D2BC1B|nr:hypothetical protein [Microbispora sp. GKU 823]OPG13633.1 hypothetical protein B1L11_06505 [Microbispora sp. GKU 823]